MPLLASIRTAIGVPVKAIALVIVFMVASLLLDMAAGMGLGIYYLATTLSPEKSMALMEQAMKNYLFVAPLTIACYCLLVGIIVFVLTVVDRKRLTFEELGLRRARAPKLFLTGIGLFAAFMALTFMIEEATMASGLLGGQSFYSLVAASHDPATQYAQSVVLTLFMVLAVAFGEEILYRSYIQKALTARYGVAIGLPLAALIFMASHALNSTDPLFFIDIFIAGLFLGYLYHRTGSIWVTIAYHFIQDFMAIQVMASQNEAFNAYPFFTVTATSTPVALGLTLSQIDEAISILVSIAILAALWLYGRSRPKAKDEKARIIAH